MVYESIMRAQENFGLLNVHVLLVKENHDLTEFMVTGLH